MRRREGDERWHINAIEATALSHRCNLLWYFSKNTLFCFTIRKVFVPFKDLKKKFFFLYFNFICYYFLPYFLCLLLFFKMK